MVLRSTSLLISVIPRKIAMTTPNTWMLASPTSAMMRAKSPTERSARKKVMPMTKRAKARMA